MPEDEFIHPRVASRAACRIEKLRAAALRLEAHHQELLGMIDPMMRESARNLVHYLAVRSYDIRGLQSDLAQMGLSSLGRMEAHALASLDIVIAVLSMMRRLPFSTVQPDRAPVSMADGPPYWSVTPALFSDHPPQNTRHASWSPCHPKRHAIPS
ncbi:hypothetical protein [Massilia cavernae]|uniref:hypothetical protein n=1 Tax=Massilia cavernae TaxID=2320864 RepID=UPI0011C43CC8|nr:hypothetical protein [Massilia cavernae]